MVGKASISICGRPHGACFRDKRRQVCSVCKLYGHHRRCQVQGNLLGKKGDGKGQGLRGFARKLEAERIVGATDSTGELMYLIKVPYRPYTSFKFNLTPPT